MKRHRKLLLISLIVLFLATQACLIPLPDWSLFNNLDRILCTNLTGKEWVEDQDGGQCLSPPESDDGQTAEEGELPDEENQPQGSQEFTSVCLH